MRTEPPNFDTPLDFILPYRKEDALVWREANKIGRILFPFYIALSLVRTVSFLVLMLIFIPLLPIIYLVDKFESSDVTHDLGKRFSNFFKKPECRRP